MLRLKRDPIGWCEGGEDVDPEESVERRVNEEEEKEVCFVEG